MNMIKVSDWTFTFLQERVFHKIFIEKVQTPKANLLQIGIELLHFNNMEYRREFLDSVSVVYYDFWIRLMIY